MAESVSSQDNIPEPTPRMIEFYEQRTHAHIARVAANLTLMAAETPYEAELLARAQTHDQSKFGPEEKLLYVWLTEFHRCRHRGIDFEYPDGVSEQVQRAVTHHMTHNRHHPEFHDDVRNMTEVDLIEMVCDWTAMSQEFNQSGGSAREWADRTVDHKVPFSKSQKTFIYQMIEKLDALIATSPIALAASRRPGPQETLEEKIARLTREEVELVAYNDQWPSLFQREQKRLRTLIDEDLIGRIEHFGSTAVAGLTAKPIIDILVEVSDVNRTRQEVPPILEPLGYEFVWRPTRGDDGPPWYAWFIKRDPVTLSRTHHIHMVEPGYSEHWDHLYFRDYLRKNPELAAEYSKLKSELANSHPNDRVGYTIGKTEFVDRVTEQAIRFFTEY